MSKKYVSECNLVVTNCRNNIECAVGDGNCISIKRRVARCIINLRKMGTLEKFDIVMDQYHLDGGQSRLRYFGESQSSH